MTAAFSIAALPQIEFGRGKLERLPKLVGQFGNSLLLVTGKRTFLQSSHWEKLQQGFREQGISWQLTSIPGEPSPQQVDDIVQAYRSQTIDLVVGIGGGSTLDAAKAIAGLLRIPNSVMDFLEGVGPELPYTGPATPWIAVPTTAGTGSEATKNAVLSQQGEQGFKKSFRDPQLIAKIALVDPALLASCPASLIAANGMDALTQLMESYLSLRANPFTDALAISGIRAARDSLLAWYHQGEAATDAQNDMAYASLNSGICLAQTGLGSVHGLASPLGAFFPIPHGVVCGTLAAAAMRVNIRAMQEREPNNPALAKCKTLATVLSNRKMRSADEALDALVATLADWTEQMRIPRLQVYGIGEKDFDRIVANSRGSSMLTNPIKLVDEEIRQILRERL